MSQNRKTLRRRVERAESLTPQPSKRWTLYWVTDEGVERAGFPDEPPLPLEAARNEDAPAGKRRARSKSSKTSSRKKAVKRPRKKTLKKASKKTSKKASKKASKRSKRRGR